MQHREQTPIIIMILLYMHVHCDFCTDQRRPHSCIDCPIAVTPSVWKCLKEASSDFNIIRLRVIFTNLLLWQLPQQLYVKTMSIVGQSIISFNIPRSLWGCFDKLQTAPSSLPLIDQRACCRLCCT